MRLGGSRCRAYASVCAAFALFAGNLCALDSKRLTSQCLHDAWRIEQGLPRLSIHAIAQTPDGYLWIGNETGLIRFDGVRFTVFDKSNTPELRVPFVFRLAVTGDGSLWLGTRGGGLLRLKDGHFTRYTERDGLVNDDIWALHVGRDDSLWIGTRKNGLCRLKDGRFTSIGKSKGLADEFVTCVIDDRQGAVWIGTLGGGLHRYKDGRMEIFTSGHGLPNNAIRSVLEDREGRILVGTEGDDLWMLENGRFVRHGAASLRMPMDVDEDKDGNVWVATPHSGLWRIPSGHPERASVWEDGVNLRFNCVFEDSEGCLWIGTQQDGLHRIRDGAFTSLAAREGLMHEDVWSIRQTRDGSAWIGTLGGGLYRMAGDGDPRTLVRVGSPGIYVTALEEGRDGSLWIGDQSTGLHRLRDGQWTQFGPEQGLPDTNIWSLCQSRDGSLWVGTRDRGLSRFKDGRFTTLTRQNGLASNTVRVLHEDRKGALWIGTQSSGLNCLTPQGIQKYNRRDGLSSDSVRALYEDGAGSLWIGTSEGGLNRLKDGKISVFNTGNGMPWDTVFHIMEDDFGCLWVSGSQGVARLTKKELEDFADGRGKTYSATVFNELDGMDSSECNGGFPPAGWNMSDGRLWFATKKGVAIVNPARPRINLEPPPVMIETVMVNGAPLESWNQASLSPGSSRISIHYTATCLAMPSRVRFRYRLEGVDRDWVQARTQRSADYANLQPGRYRFHVVACNNDGVWNTTGAAFGFYIAPHFYQSAWFYALGIGLVGVLGMGAHRLRLRTIQARELALRNTVEARTQELRQEVAERQHADDALRESEARFRLLSEATFEGIGIQDGGRLIEANQSLSAMFGYTRLELQERSVTDLVEPESRNAVRVRLATGDEKPFEAVGIRSNGTTLPVQVALKRCSYAGREAVVLVIRDITERKDSERQLRDIPKHIVQAQEGERHRVAQELHDGVSQMLHSVKFRLQAVEGQLRGLDVPAGKQAGKARTLLENALGEIRRISRNLRPSELDDLGLQAALRSAADDFRERTGLETMLLLPESLDNLPSDVETTLYRVVQEALNNVEKHARATQVVIGLNRSERSVNAVIRDNGQGAAARSSDEPGRGRSGLGLLGMKERAALLGGSFRWESTPDLGTTVWIEIPLPAAPVHTASASGESIPSQ